MLDSLNKGTEVIHWLSILIEPTGNYSLYDARN